MHISRMTINATFLLTEKAQLNMVNLATAIWASVCDRDDFQLTVKDKS